MWRFIECWFLKPEFAEQWWACVYKSSLRPLQGPSPTRVVILYVFAIFSVSNYHCYCRNWMLTILAFVSSFRTGNGVFDQVHTLVLNEFSGCVQAIISWECFLAHQVVDNYLRHVAFQSFRKPPSTRVSCALLLGGRLSLSLFTKNMSSRQRWLSTRNPITGFCWRPYRWICGTSVTRLTLLNVKSQRKS